LPADRTSPADAYARYGPALVRKAERVLRNREDAIDVVHGLFADLLSQPETPMELPYLYRAVTHRCLNLVRDAHGRARLLVKQQAVVAPSSRLSDGSRLLDIDLLGRLCEGLDGGHLEVMVCRYVDEMTQEEIGVHLGLSRKTIGKRLARIHERLAELDRGAA
jgi:RNA polymerase sigma-70 factor (ECF subfamily)